MNLRKPKLELESVVREFKPEKEFKFSDSDTIDNLAIFPDGRVFAIATSPKPANSIEMMEINLSTGKIIRRQLFTECVRGNETNCLLR